MGLSGPLGLSWVSQACRSQNVARFVAARTSSKSCLGTRCLGSAWGSAGGASLAAWLTPSRAGHAGI